MRLLFLVLLVLLGLIQYPLWLGKGSWLKVWDLQRQVTVQHGINEGLRARNTALEAEVRDLEVGSGAIEERARAKLGMMREGEIFVHILPQSTQAPTRAKSFATPAPISKQPSAKPAALAPTRAPSTTRATPAPQ